MKDILIAAKYLIAFLFFSFINGLILGCISILDSWLFGGTIMNHFDIILILSIFPWTALWIVYVIKDVRKGNKDIDPLEHNEKLFERFWDDLQNDKLHIIKDREIKKYIKLYNQHKENVDPNINEKQRANLDIPVEIRIWVDRVYHYYFHDLQPLIGGVHGTESVIKALYRYKGYNYYTIQECHPEIIFD